MTNDEGRSTDRMTKQGFEAARNTSDFVISHSSLQSRLIATDTGLAELLAKIDPVDRVAIDTEADSLHSYREKLCLLQISLPGVAGTDDRGLERRDFIVDPLATVAGPASRGQPLQSQQSRKEKGLGDPAGSANRLPSGRAADRSCTVNGCAGAKGNRVARRGLRSAIAPPRFELHRVPDFRHGHCRAPPWAPRVWSRRFDKALLRRGTWQTFSKGKLGTAPTSWKDAGVCDQRRALSIASGGPSRNPTAGTRPD